MKTLYADLPLVEGEAHIVDFDLATLKENDIPFLRKIGIVFQDFKLLPDRIKDNMLFVLKATGWTIKEDMDRKIDEVLDKVGMKIMPVKCHIKSPVENNNVSLPEHCLMIPNLSLLMSQREI
jgi:cell division transport system ATP-binding protein